MGIFIHKAFVALTPRQNDFDWAVRWLDKNMPGQFMCFRTEEYGDFGIFIPPHGGMAGTDGELAHHRLLEEFAEMLEGDNDEWEWVCAAFGSVDASIWKSG